MLEEYDRALSDLESAEQGMPAHPRTAYVKAILHARQNRCGIDN